MEKVRKTLRAAAVAAALAAVVTLGRPVLAEAAAPKAWPDCVVAMVIARDGREAAVPGAWHFVPTAYAATKDGRAYATAGYWRCEVDRLTTPQALLAAMGQ